MTEASEEDEKCTTRPKDWRQRRRRWWIDDGPGGVYDDNRGIGGGRWARRLKQQKRRRQRRIDDAYKVLDTTTEAAADLRQARWIGNDNEVLVFLVIGLLTVTLSCLCLFAVSFWYCFHQIPFFSFTARNTISTAIMCKIFLYQVYTNLVYVLSKYRRVKNYKFAWSINTYVNP